jgi:hypothetical protein
MLDVTAKLAARSMEARLDSLLADGETFCSLRCAEALYVAEHEDGPELLRQTVDRGSKNLAKLPVGRPIFRPGRRAFQAVD